MGLKIIFSYCSPLVLSPERCRSRSINPFLQTCGPEPDLGSARPRILYTPPRKPNVLYPAARLHTYFNIFVNTRQLLVSSYRIRRIHAPHSIFARDRWSETALCNCGIGHAKALTPQGTISTLERRQGAGLSSPHEISAHTRLPLSARHAHDLRSCSRSPLMLPPGAAV